MKQQPVVAGPVVVHMVPGARVVADNHHCQMPLLALALVVPAWAWQRRANPEHTLTHTRQIINSKK